MTGSGGGGGESSGESIKGGELEGGDMSMNLHKRRVVACCSAVDMLRPRVFLLLVL